MHYMHDMLDGMGAQVLRILQALHAHLVRAHAREHVKGELHVIVLVRQPHGVSVSFIDLLAHRNHWKTE